MTGSGILLHQEAMGRTCRAGRSWGLLAMVAARLGLMALFCKMGSSQSRRHALSIPSIVLEPPYTGKVGLSLKPSKAQGSCEETQGLPRDSFRGCSSEHVAACIRSGWSEEAVLVLEPVSIRLRALGSFQTLACLCGLQACDRLNQGRPRALRIETQCQVSGNCFQKLMQQQDSTGGDQSPYTKPAKALANDIRCNTQPTST